MKKLMALVALVAMVAVSSVASAATVNVTASVNSVSTINDCTGADFGTSLDTEDTIQTASCTGTMTSTVAAGYDLTYSATTATLVSGLDVIESGATCTATAVECFSYKFDNSDAGATVVGTSTSEHAVPVVAAVQVQKNTTYDGDYGMTFYAVSRIDTPAGTYTNSGTALLAAFSG